MGGMELLASELPEADKRPPLTIGTWVQYVLDNCGSVQEAILVDELVRIEDQAPPSHFLIADAEGSCVAIEWLDGHLVYYTGENLPVKAMSNMRYARALKAFKRGGPRWWWSNPGQSAERFAGAATRNADYDENRYTNAMSYSFETLTQVVAAPHTKWNIVYDIAKREVLFRSVASPAVKHISLRAFDLSCTAPLLMLDMNAALDGNVEKSFKPYDYDVNLKVFQTLCSRYGIEVSTEDAVGIMQLFESFECAR